MSRILFDGRSLQSPPPRGGVGVVAEQLLQHLLAGDTANEYLLFVNGMGNFAGHLPVLTAPHARWMRTYWPNKCWNAAARCGLPVLRPPEVDVVFLPNLNFLPPLHRCTKLVVMVHDLSFVHFPDCFTPKQRLWHHAIRPRTLLQRANAIVAVSHTTARDIVDTYGIPTSRVHVIPPGITHCAPTESPHALRSRYALPVKFILTLSAWEPRKNLDGLIAAFEQCATHPELQDTHLIIAGIPGSATRTIRRLADHSAMRNRIRFLSAIPDHEKHALYALATCFAYPSIWEGFGIPPLEAMAAGTPVVASTGGSLPEILGNAALLVDPLDPGAIARAIVHACTDHHLRAEIIAQGRARAQRYSWITAAQQLHHLLIA
ncbi:glycosyltransferase family 4 protein [Candidatus Uhrbacteria bacterium]|nr:glycosyltransferase family 4 protein [Candidatus Uhrbacteria bacterium]